MIIIFAAAFISLYIQVQIHSYQVLYNNNIIIYQLWFLEEGGCSIASFVFNSVAKYFRLKRNNVFCCSLDAKKALDRLNHIYLLSCVIDTGFPLCIVNLFAS